MFTEKIWSVVLMSFEKQKFKVMQAAYTFPEKILCGFLKRYGGAKSYLIMH